MMVAYSLTHILLLIATFLFISLLGLIASKLKRKGQNVLFTITAFLCFTGIFFRYGMGLSFTKLDLKTFFFELMQVCSFNAILLPLMLIPKFEFARQLSVYFFMISAITTFLSPSSSWANYHWYDLVVFNSWMNHVFAVCLPVEMMAAKRLKPQKKYILPITIFVIIYFLIGYLIQSNMISNGTLTIQSSLSFIFRTENIPLFNLLYKLIPYPFFYLLPLLPLLVLYFYLLSKFFDKYKVKKY